MTPADDAEKPIDDAEKPTDDAEKPTDDAEEPGDDVDDAGKPGGRERAGARLPTVALSVAIALVVAAATVAVWFGVSWLRAANDDGVEYSSMRDDVDRIARGAIITMNTLDYRKLDQGLKDWSDATTGTMHDEIGRLTDKNKQQLKDAKSVTSAQVLSSAVKELDERAGKATVLAAVKLTVSIKGGKPADKYQRISAELQRVGDGWKLANMGQVSYTQPAQPSKPNKSSGK